jgi:hypothetical protein
MSTSFTNPTWHGFKLAFPSLLTPANNPTPTPVLLVLLAILLSPFVSRILRRPRSPHARLPLPPGPKPLPLLGNVLDMPKEHEYLTYAEWGGVYGKSGLARMVMHLMECVLFLLLLRCVFPAFVVPGHRRPIITPHQCLTVLPLSIPFDAFCSIVSYRGLRTAGLPVRGA